MSDAIKELFSSKKALILIVTSIGAFVLVALGRIPWDKAVAFMTVTVPAWLVAVGIEDAAKHVATANVAVAKATIPPPPPAVSP